MRYMVLLLSHLSPTYKSRVQEIENLIRPHYSAEFSREYSATLFNEWELDLSGVDYIRAMRKR